MGKKKASKVATKAASSPRKSANKAAKKGHSKRLDPADFGIDLAAIVDEIKPLLMERMTLQEIGDAAGLSRMVVSHIFNGHGSLSLGAVASLASVAEGRLVVKFERGKK